MNTVSRVPAMSRQWLIAAALVAGVLVTNIAVSRVLQSYATPRLVAFDMKGTLDRFMDDASKKTLSPAQSKSLSDRFNRTLETVLADYQQNNHVVILVSPAVVQGAPDVTLKIQTEIARRMQEGSR